VHELTGLITDFPDDPSVDQSAIQWGETDPDSLHDDVGAAWDDAAGRFNLNLAEARDWGTGDLARQLGWAVAMAGAYFMPIDWDIVNTPTQRLLECGYLRRFFEQAELSALTPADHLAAGATNYVLADEGAVYLAYSREPDDLGLTNLPPGQPLQRWLDVRSGAIEETAVQVAGGTVFFARPAGIGQEAALYLDYGRAELFADGFESADTTAWSTTVP
jgi:hypothetical protein